MCFLRSLKG